MNKKRSIYNMTMGLFSQMLILATSILLPRLIMVSMGSEANGLINSVNQALVYLSLLEAGVGTVTIQALYKPVAEDDKGSICRILAAAKKYYLRTGTVFAVLVLVFSVIYPLLVKTELPAPTVMLVILFSGGGSVLTYFINGKYWLLLQAEGKHYIRSAVSTTIHILLSAAKIGLLLAGFDVVAIQAAYFGAMLIQSTFEYIYIKRNYQWLDLDVTPDEKAIEQKNSVLVHQICGLLFNNTDTLLLTFSWGLRFVSVYAVYNLVFSQLTNIILTLNSSVLFVLGQSYQTDRAKFKTEYNLFELVYFLCTFIMASIVAVLIVPFIKLYTSGVTDVDYLSAWYAVLFNLVFILSNLRGPAQTSITVAGYFKKTTKQALIETGINLVVSIILLPKFGIIGVLLGTCAGLLYRTTDMILFSAKHIHNQKLSRTYLRLFRNLIPCAAFILTGVFAPPPIGSFLSFIIYGILFSLLSVAVFLAINLPFERNLRALLAGIVKKVIGRKGK